MNRIHEGFTQKEFEFFYSVIDNREHFLLFYLLYSTGISVNQLQMLRFKDLVNKNDLLLGSRIRYFNERKFQDVYGVEKLTIDYVLADSLRGFKLKQQQRDDYSNDNYFFGYDKMISKYSLEKLKNNYIIMANNKYNIDLPSVTLNSFRHAYKVREELKKQRRGFKIFKL